MMENKNDLQGWEEIEKELKNQASSRKPFPPFLHQRIMSALNDEKQKPISRCQKLLSWSGGSLAFGAACVLLFFFMKQEPQIERSEAEKVLEWISLLAHSDYLIHQTFHRDTLNQFIFDVHEDRAKPMREYIKNDFLAPFEPFFRQINPSPNTDK